MKCLLLPLWAAGLLLAILGGAGNVRAQAPATRQAQNVSVADEEAIAALARQVGSPIVQERIDARKKLLAMGEPARLALTRMVVDGTLDPRTANLIRASILPALNDRKRQADQLEAQKARRPKLPTTQFAAPAVSTPRTTAPAAVAPYPAPPVANIPLSGAVWVMVVLFTTMVMGAIAVGTVWIVVRNVRQTLRSAGKLPHQIAMLAEHAKQTGRTDAPPTYDGPARPEIPQPADSKILHTPTSHGFTLQIPAPGFGRGTFWMGPFSLLFCGMLGLGLWAAIHNPPLINAGGFDYWFPLGLLTFFACAFTTLLAVTCFYATRRVELGLEDGVLSVRFTGLLGTKSYQFSAAEIASVKVGASRISVGGGISTKRKGPVPQLQISFVDRGRSDLNFCTGRPSAELEWLWFVVNRGLGRR